MSSTTVRISDSTLKVLRELSNNIGEPMQAILDKAIEDFRRKLFLEEANKAYLRLRNDTEKWNEELKERQEWDTALLDGLEED
ncbi:hypothetical protein SY88_21275 [Clostridiales bacterium PH28_bin88]|nr:hypothetical protein SY88_21275 [Clostridiales bacterium PH28_bin88]